ASDSSVTSSVARYVTKRYGILGNVWIEQRRYYDSDFHTQFFTFAKCSVLITAKYKLTDIYQYLFCHKRLRHEEKLLI
ncbi:MAG: hypothetical protein RBQ66_03335, partial [Candidatus Cloacimonadaceae bacterium]|nr:hypothetical protein [Candidatus Cloacimonadaceae bacterium]